MRVRKFWDWQTRMAAFIKERSRAPFSWGVHDCSMFACAAVEAITGVNPGTRLQGYSTAKGAQGKLNKYSEGSLEKAAEMLGAEHGFKEVGAKYIQRGDVCLVIIPETKQPALAVVDMTGRNVILPAETGGITRLPPATIKRAWRIG